MGRKHHFVPRFYLKAFASAPRQIHVFNLKRVRAIPNVSLRDQCQAHQLYGCDDVESSLAEIEDVAALLFSVVTGASMLPRPGTPEHDVLLIFIGLQLVRTIAARDNALELWALFMDAAYDGKAPPASRSSPAETMKIVLDAAPSMAATIRDLEMTLIQAPPNEAFFTSDNPAFKYNTYCEGIRYAGVTGTKCIGFQIFLPLSPRILLCLYDGQVYKSGKRRTSHFVQATSDDVRALNRLQVMSANANLYFTNWQSASEIERLAAELESLRAADRPRVVKAVDVADENSQLLHQFWPMPQLQLRLSFMSIRRNARRIELLARARQVRTPYKRPQRRERESGAITRFETRNIY